MDLSPLAVDRAHLVCSDMRIHVQLCSGGMPADRPWCGSDRAWSRDALIVAFEVCFQVVLSGKNSVALIARVVLFPPVVAYLQFYVLDLV